MSTPQATNSTKKWLRPFGYSPYVFVTYMASVALFIFGLISAFVFEFVDSVYIESRHIRFIVPTVVGMFLLCNTTLIMRGKLKLKVPLFVDIYIIFACMGHAFGHVFAWYDRGWHWDKILHGAAGVGFTFIGLSLASLFAKKKNPLENRQTSLLFVIMFAVAFSGLVAVMWEVLEFVLDAGFGMNSQRWRDSLLALEEGYLYFMYAYVNGVQQRIYLQTLEYGELFFMYIYRNGYSYRYYLTSSEMGRIGQAVMGSGLIDTMLDMTIHIIGTALAVPLVMLIIHKLKQKGKSTDCLFIYPARLDFDNIQQCTDNKQDNQDDGELVAAVAPGCQINNKTITENTEE